MSDGFFSVVYPTEGTWQLNTISLHKQSQAGQ